jgi:hypothetical protein
VPRHIVPFLVARTHLKDPICPSLSHPPSLTIVNGKLAWLRFLIRIMEFHNIHIQGKIHSYCDNLSIVQETKSTNDFDTIRSKMQADYDVLNEIIISQHTIQRGGVELCDTRHVKGHQDDNNNTELSWEAQLNIAADDIASTTLAKMRRRGEKPTNDPMPNCEAYLTDHTGELFTSTEVCIMKWRWSEFRLQTKWE